MGRYRLVFRKSVARDLKAIPKADLQRILKRVRGLSEDPRPPGSEKLTGLERYRVRQGSYRILYEIHHEEILVVVVKVAHRRESYRG